MTAAVLNFDNDQVGHIEQGATWRFSFTWEDSARNPIDVSYYSIKMQVRKNYGQTLIIELSTTNGRIVVDSNNEITLLLTSEETAALTKGRYIYDLKLTDISGADSNGNADDIRLLEGEFIVSPGVTI